MARPFYSPSPKPEEPPKNTPDDNGKLRPGRGKESYKLACFWKEQIEGYEQFNQRWFAKGNMVLKRYRDERSKMENEALRRFNILWANVQIMKPAIYSRMPDPIVDRRFLDKDPIGRLSSVILERTIISQMEHGFHSAMNRAVYDRLLPGRGQVWLRYENEIEGEENEENSSIPTQSSNSLEDSLAKIAKDVGDEKLIEETAEDDSLEETGDITLVEKIITDYIDWRDFYTFPARARTWEEVQAVCKRVYMSKQECFERFGEKIAQEMQPDTTPESSANNRTSITDTQIFKDVNDRSIVVYEIWNKSDRRVYWVSNGYDFLCDVRKDPYKLKKFFPCPKPLSATVTNDSLTPVPDYCEYQDQAIQIDELTQRIAMLTKACKVAGVYNAANKQLARIFEEVSENQLIGVDQWAMFAEAGGIKGAIDFVPLDQIQTCIKTLQEVRQATQQDLDQITGISDVVRGTTDSRETLGGIRLKNNNAGTRLSENQEEVQRFARDVIAIIGELAAKHFEDDTLVQASGIMYDEEMQPDAVLREFEPLMPGFMATSQNQSTPANNSNPAAGGSNGPSPTSVPPITTPQQSGQPPAPTQGNVIPFPGQQPGQMQPNGQPSTPDSQVIIGLKLDAAIKLLRKDVPRNYRISIETDSTIFGDKIQERQDASDFIEALGGYMANFEKLGQEVPEAMPLLGRGLEWAARKFRIGRDLEAEINSFVARMEKKAKKLIENPQPSIEQQKLQADKEKNMSDNQFKLQLAQMEAQREQANDEREAQMQQQNDMRDAQKAQMEDERQAQLMQIEIQMKREELEFKRQENMMKLEMMREQMKMELAKANIKASTEQQSAQTNMAVKQHESNLNMQAAEMQHQHKMRESEVASKGTEQKAEIQEKSHEQKKEIMDHTAEHKKKQLQMQSKAKVKK